jgi:predicted ester cyclase
MTIAGGKAAARSYFEEVLNRGDMTVADGIFTPGVRFQYPLGNLKGPQAVKNYIAAVREAFPDITFTVEDIFAEADRVAARWSLAGTQTGPFRGKPPTCKWVAVDGNTLFRLQNGRIDEMWVAFDPARLA